MLKKELNEFPVQRYDDILNNNMSNSVLNVTDSGEISGGIHLFSKILLILRTN